MVIAESKLLLVRYNLWWARLRK